MLDPDEMEAYELWKEHKLTTSTDLSVRAYNIEKEAPALAYEAGVRAAFSGMIAKQNADDVIAASPYRRAGMAGHKRVTGE